jgi:hypothetical protein
METDRTDGALGVVRDRWRRLDADWQAVVIGAAVVSAVALGVRIPW